MDILGVGFPELVFIFVIALMIFGPRRLPEIAARVGKTVRDLRSMSQGLLTEWQREITVAARLEELEAARKEIEEVKQELKQAKQTVTAETST
ncbi:MAG: Sec-independent protein translocase protein TatB, partial [Anaerolineae bacterium]|nr:Sec-independent protein translocase protein TatB [Anaerolineae bacterium]